MWKGHVAAVTGAGQGMGREMALRLAREGVAGLALADIKSDELLAVAEECERAAPSGFRVSTHQVDLSQAELVEQFAREVEEAHGSCSMLINNAGIVSVGDFADVSKADYDRVMAINFEAVVNGSRSFLPMLRRSEKAHLVNISSMYGYFASRGNASYHASKFAVRGFTEALVRECWETMPHVQVHSVHPGFVFTQLMENADVHPNADMDKEGVKGMFDAVGRTTADKAAEIILANVAAGKSRIIVGPDAISLDYLVRLFPTSNLFYMRLPALALTLYHGFIAAKLRDMADLSDHTAWWLTTIGHLYLAKQVAARL